MNQIEEIRCDHCEQEFDEDQLNEDSLCEECEHEDRVARAEAQMDLD
jgi:predicted Zn-ribbon and HTH transcriptional regulator